MKRAFLGAALALAACSNTSSTVASGQFASPVGLAVTSAGDRDLIFVANSGRDGLIALQLCNHALLDGGVDPSDTCSANENAQFIPGPIRVFPGLVETNEHSVRVAGPRLLRSDNTAVGAALAVGADDTLRTVDAKALVDVEHGLKAAPVVNPPVALGGIGVDVVAANPLDPNTDLEVAAPSVKVFAATVAPNQLIVLTSSLDAAGNVQLPTIDATCDLGTVLPRKLAVAPGRDDVVYVADGAGDGVVSVPRAGIAGGPCPITRISAGGRPVHSLALSPPFFVEGKSPLNNPPDLPTPAGSILMMVLEPLAASVPGKPLDAGGVIFARTSDGALLPVPAFPWDEAGHEGMAPLEPSGLAREGTFMRALRPSSSCPGSCTPVFVGIEADASTGFAFFQLLAAVDTSDGSTWFIDVLKRRFVNTNFYNLSVVSTSLAPTAVEASVPISPAESPGAALGITVPADGSTAGITRTGDWRVIWHSPVTGLDRRAGRLTRDASGNLLLSTAPADLGVWTADPVFHIGAGDEAAFALWGSTDPACADLVANLNASQLTFQLPIVAISASSITFADPAGKVALGGSCAAVDTVAEVHVAGSDPWLIFDGSTPIARWHSNEAFTVRERRFDYPYQACDPAVSQPLCYSQTTPPTGTEADSFSFTITGPNPSYPAISGFSFNVLSGQAPVLFRDSSIVSGFASGILAYSSPRLVSLLFVSMTGSDELLEADPALLSGSVLGVQVFR